MSNLPALFAVRVIQWFGVFTVLLKEVNDASTHI